MKKTLLLLHSIAIIMLVVTFYGGPPMGKSQMHPWDLAAFLFASIAIIVCPLSYLCFCKKFGFQRFRKITASAIVTVVSFATSIGIITLFGWPDFLATPIWQAVVYLNSPPLPVPPDKFTGTWYFNRTFIPNQEYPWPAEFEQFRLILAPNGTFSATHIPENFFFSRTPIAAHLIDRGKWEVHALSGQKFYHLNLIFESPNPGYLGSSIQMKSGSFVVQLAYDHKMFYLSRDGQSEVNSEKIITSP